MNIVLLQANLRNKLSYAIHLRPFSSQKFEHDTRAKRLDKALRVLDILAPKTRIAADCNKHLRLIQDFLQTDSNQKTECTNFSSLKSDNLLFEGTPDFSVINNGDYSDEWLGIDASDLSNTVSSCASNRNFWAGVQYHCLAIRTRLVANVYVGSSLITFYAKCSEVRSAYKLFEEMPVRNVVSWTAIISGFVQEGKFDACLELYSAMRNSTLKPNDYTFVSLLSACTGRGVLGQGRSMHCQIIQMGFDSYLHIANSLISMYCKSGSIECALYIFENMGFKDVVSWNSMITGYAQHGSSLEAIELFEKMKRHAVRPDAITFLGVLCACRHAGFVAEGRKYLNSMIEYGMTPELDHYSCLVDLLGRSKLLEEARDLIQNMPMPPNEVIWGSLLSSCRLHGNVWIGIEAAKSKLLLAPECVATHVELANLYASVGCWDQSARVRKSINDGKFEKPPGYSWIEIRNEVHRFRAEDVSNTRLGEILTVLHCLVYHTLTYGCAVEIQEVSNVFCSKNVSL